jgi:hypothetical protein
MSFRRKKKDEEKVTSTKQLKGKRINGVLYLDKGERTGSLDRINVSFDDDNAGSSHIMGRVSNQRDYYDK